eukprot:15454192-Alexandrium_andersonii.AAC.1
MPDDGVLPDTTRPRMCRFALYPNAAEFRRLLRDPDRVWLLAEPVGGHSIGSEIPVEAPDAVVSPDGLGALVR